MVSLEEIVCSARLFVRVYESDGWKLSVFLDGYGLVVADRKHNHVYGYGNGRRGGSVLLCFVGL